MLRCVRAYRNQNMIFEPGQVISDLDPAVEDWLLRDAPGVFERIGSETKALDAPPQDKMMRRAIQKGEVMTRETHRALMREQHRR
jgi:hypothetical protein